MKPVGSVFVLDGLVNLHHSHHDGQDRVEDGQEDAVVPVPQLIDPVSVHRKGHWGGEQCPEEAKDDEGVAGEAVADAKPFIFGWMGT